MNNTTRWILAVVVAGAGAALLLLPRHQTPEPQNAVSVEKPQARGDTDQALTRFPVPKSDTQTAATEPEKPLPALQESDAAIQESLGKLFDPGRLGELFIFKDMIHRLVITIDNLPRAKLPLQSLPTLPPPGKFAVTQQGINKAEINPDNYQRYARYVQFAEEIDAQKLAALYFHFYPLFQQAYNDLGYKSAYFNDRLVAVIDDLLATPRINDPVSLVQPSVFYKYADPRLEGLSAGQKLMLRIGSNNAETIKTKLLELRQALTARTHDRP
jgi:hypothetical protein